MALQQMLQRYKYFIDSDSSDLCQLNQKELSIRCKYVQDFY